ncbi:hypothetical protein L1887_57369 [Cichorium endivia]|nr:hypothetical protein L1887_57369 [Cichorium endivia]
MKATETAVGTQSTGAAGLCDEVRVLDASISEAPNVCTFAVRSTLRRAGTKGGVARAWTGVRAPSVELHESQQTAPKRSVEPIGTAMHLWISTNGAIAPKPYSFAPHSLRFCCPSVATAHRPSTPKAIVLHRADALDGRVALQRASVSSRGLNAARPLQRSPCLRDSAARLRIEEAHDRLTSVRLDAQEPQGQSVCCGFEPRVDSRSIERRAARARFQS